MVRRIGSIFTHSPIHLSESYPIRCQRYVLINIPISIKIPIMSTEGADINVTREFSSNDTMVHQLQWYDGIQYTEQP